MVKTLLKEIIPRFEVPLGLSSDRGPHFTAGIVQEVARMLDISWDLHTPWRPQSSGQVERMNQTIKGFKDMNLQLQATSRMTLQNRMALDMLLLKERGVCQYLKTKIDHCCIHIPNVTIEVEKDISQLETIESKTREIEKEAQHNWIGAIFESLGLQVSG